MGFLRSITQLIAVASIQISIAVMLWYQQLNVLCFGSVFGSISISVITQGELTRFVFVHVLE